MEYEDTKLLDAQMEIVKLRDENKQLRRQLEEVRMALVKVESAWVNLKNQMVVK